MHLTPSSQRPWALALLAIGLVASSAAHADATLDKIKQRGKLSVAVDGPEAPFEADGK
jgi:polar amino acid transport system substrate-binding protein